MVETVAEKIKTHIICSKTFPENGAVYDIMWENMVQPDRPQKCVQCAYWITKGTDTHTHNV